MNGETKPLLPNRYVQLPQLLRRHFPNHFDLLVVLSKPVAYFLSVWWMSNSNI